VREYRVEALVESKPTGGLADHAFAGAAEDPGAVVFSRDERGQWRDVTAAQFAAEVLALAKGLIARGIAAGDRVAVMSRTRYEWTLFDYAIWAAGAIGVPVYPTSSVEQTRWILADSGAAACVVETAELAAVVAAAGPVGQVWDLAGGAVATLSAAGRNVTDVEVARRREAVAPDDVATIIYTSGTTGRPKGVALTHANFVAEVDNAIALLYPVFRADSTYPASTLLFLPLAHVFGRMIQVGCVRARVRLGHAPSLAQSDLVAALSGFAPTFVLGVPYVFEKVFNTGRRTAESMGRGASFDRAVRVAVRYGEVLERRAGGHDARVDVKLQLAHLLYDRLVYARIRRALGGKVQYAICGGSPLGRRLGLFFAGAGVTIYEGYGLTETCAAVTVNPPRNPRFGTVGRPLPGTTVRIADDGEVLVQGGQVFAGYWEPAGGPGPLGGLGPVDGWFATGDLGELDPDGYLTITGRKKDILVTSGGKNVAPAPLEDAIRAHPLVSQCMVVGDNRPYVAALVTLDPEAIDHWKAVHGKPAAATVGDLAADADLIAELRSAVDRANEAVSRAESIRRFRVLAGDFLESDGLLTPSLKLKRSAVGEAYADDIEKLYS
jgi:long-chain acyl-CoA synthetase